MVTEAVKLKLPAPLKKGYEKLDGILKSRGITLPKAMLFPVVMYRYESRTIKKAERQKN